ncbi:MAG TPA: 4Fe-4S dicluster domain-containing protein [Candidatus Limnocylindrales bacterium]|nr:4Fe-4S dicluster domain-containing protein [Candidatus Limnocylindrales bacterium]
MPTPTHGPDAPVPQPDPVAASPAPASTAPDPSALVPLTELAPAIQEASVSRRAFLGFGLAITGAMVGAAGLAKLFPVFADDSPAAYPISPSYDPSMRQWTFVVDTASCIGCGMCVVACKEENNVPEEGEYTRTWIERHVQTADGVVHVDAPEGGQHGFPADSTAPGLAGRAVEASWFEPRLCMQCENSPCTSVCPVGATYKTEDGVILVDARRCIGCGYCVVACPYGARYLVPEGPHTPGGYAGVADKCTWCYHRITRDLKPACVDICPVGARKFGDAATDPEIQEILATQDPLPLNPEYGTKPRVLYLGPSVTEA